MVKNECKLKLKLEKITEVENEKKTTFTWVFVPTLADLKKTVKLQITGKDPYDALGDIGLPSRIGDTVIIGFSQREEQQSLDKINKEFRVKKQKVK